MTDPDFVPSELLDNAATGFERAHTDVMAGAMYAITAELVESTWQPRTVAQELLPLAAYQASVNLYEDFWSLDTKRRWIEENWKFLSMRGTVTGLRMALAPSGYELQEIMRPPQAFYASPDLSQEEEDAWVKRMPELRITFARRTGTDNGQWFAEDGFAGVAFAGLDDGAVLYGNYAFLRQNGVVTPLDTITETKVTEGRTFTQVQRYSTPGLSTAGYFADETFAGDALFTDSDEKTSEMVTVSLDQNYDHVTSQLGLNTIVPGFKPLDARFEIDSDIEPWDFQTYADDTFEDFAGVEEGERMLARRIYLLDPSIQAPRTIGVSFADYDRVGMPLRTVEVLIDLNAQAGPSDAFAEESFAVDVFAVTEDTSHVDRALRSIEASRGHLDRVLARFDHLRPLQVRDTVDEGTLVGDWVPNSL
jgi:phage tail P2-like protein